MTRQRPSESRRPAAPVPGPTGTGSARHAARARGRSGDPRARPARAGCARTRAVPARGGPGYRDERRGSLRTGPEARRLGPALAHRDELARVDDGAQRRDEPGALVVAGLVGARVLHHERRAGRARALVRGRARRDEVVDPRADAPRVEEASRHHGAAGRVDGGAVASGAKATTRRPAVAGYGAPVAARTALSASWGGAAGGRHPTGHRRRRPRATRPRRRRGTSRAARARPARPGSTGVHRRPAGRGAGRRASFARRRRRHGSRDARASPRRRGVGAGNALGACAQDPQAGARRRVAGGGVELGRASFGSHGKAFAGGGGRAIVARAGAVAGRCAATVRAPSPSVADPLAGNGRAGATGGVGAVQPGRASTVAASARPRATWPSHHRGYQTVVWPIRCRRATAVGPRTPAVRVRCATRSSSARSTWPLSSRAASALRPVPAECPSSGQRRSAQSFARPAASKNRS